MLNFQLIKADTSSCLCMAVGKPRLGGWGPSCRRKVNLSLPTGACSFPPPLDDGLNGIPHKWC